MYECKIENKKLLNRINRIAGQVNSLKKRLNEDFKCDNTHNPYEVIRELSAIKGAVNGMINSYIEHFAKGHLVKEIRDAKDESSALAQMDNLIEILKSFGK